MAFTTVFVDSFGHYDTAGIPLKWSTAGGAIETNPAHTRTNGRSLRIQSGNAPTMVPNGNQGSGGLGLAGSGPSIVGFAWQTSILAGDTIMQLQEFNSGDIQIKMVQNADGSISLFNGALGQQIGSSAAGVLTTGAWYYLELMVNLNPFSALAVTQAVLTVTPDSTGVPAQVINVTGFGSSQFEFNALLWGGPVSANNAWVADFYNQSHWDGTGDVTAVVGAPKIYATVPKSPDGLDFVVPGIIVTPLKTMAFDGTAAPWWNQVNEIPETTGAPIFETIGQDAESAWTWTNIGQGFVFDLSAIPSNAKVAAVQNVNMFGAAAVTEPNDGEYPCCIVYRTGDPIPTAPIFAGDPQPWALTPGESSPFTFYCVPFDTNRVTGDPLVLSDLVGSTALQFGPAVGAVD